jgi:hypothetical protein
VASYYWIEKPLIKLGHHLAKPATSGREDLDESPAVDREAVTLVAS